jgi:hypothetical protein
MIQERGSATVSSPTSIHPESRVITMGAASEDFCFWWAAVRLSLCIDAEVEFVIFVRSFSSEFSLRFS